MPDAFYRRLSELFMVTSHWHIFPDAYPTLTALKERGLIVGAVSNWVWNLPELLHALDLVSHFDFIAASARIGFEKPHPRIFQWALDQAGVPAESVIHVGDHVDADVEGARAVGITGVLIDRTHRHRPEDVPGRRAGHPFARRAAADRRRAPDGPMSERWRCFVAVPLGDSPARDLADCRRGVAQRIRPRRPALDRSGRAGT